MKTEKPKWAVGLSNGLNFYEGKGDYAIIRGELSPWQKLKAYLKDNPNIRITSMSLYTDEGKRFNLPSAGKNPKFKIFCDAEQPKEYNFFRKAGMDSAVGGKQESQETFSVIEAIYENKKLQIWVNNENPNNSWSVMI